MRRKARSAATPWQRTPQALIPGRRFLPGTLTSGDPLRIVQRDMTRKGDLTICCHPGPVFSRFLGSLICPCERIMLLLALGARQCQW